MKIEKALGKLARFEEKRPFLMIGIFVVLTIFLMSGFSLIKSESSFEDFVPEDVEVITAINEVRDKFGLTTQSIIIIFKTDPDDPDYIRDVRDREVLIAMDKITKQVESHDFILASSSILDSVKNGSDIPDQRTINEILSTNEGVETLLSDDFSITLVRFTVTSGLSLEQLNSLVRNVKDVIAFSDRPLGIEVIPAGDIVVDAELPAVIGQRTGSVTLIGFIGVFFVLLIIFRKFSLAAIPMVPVIFGTLWTFGTLGIIGIPLSTALVGIFSMIIGLGIDFGIHIVHRFEEEKKKTDTVNAIESAVTHIGKGLTLTSVTTIIGFLALLFATLPALNNMSVALSFGVFYSLIASIGMIPPILVLTERRKFNKKKKHNVE